jgi:hypothetical protein
MSQQTPVVEPTSDFVEVKAINTIHHGGDQQLPGSVFLTDRKTANYLIAHNAASLATETAAVSIEEQMPPNIDAKIFCADPRVTVCGTRPSVFMLREDRIRLGLGLSSMP